MDVSNLIDFLNQNPTVYRRPDQSAKIIVADDQFVSQQAIRLSFEDRQIAERLLTFSNG